MKKWILRIVVLFIITLGLVFIFYVYPKLPIINGYAAKRACSSVFVAGRKTDNIKAEDLSIFPQNIASLKIDNDKKIASASVLGLSKSEAVYRPGLGCKLVIGTDDYPTTYTEPKTKILLPTDSLPWPYGLKEVDPNLSQEQKEKLEAAIDEAFDSDDQWEKKTRAMLVMKNGQLLTERYKPPYNRETPFLGWSMTKSITNILFGIRAKQGKIDVKKNDVLPQWSNDDRRNITIDNLLRMSSGLQWNEAYGSVSQVTEMLFLEESAPDYAISAPKESEPGTVWEYSSGTTNILGQILKNTFEKEKNYLDFPEVALFKKLNLTSAQIETDETNHYVLSSYMYASARDWAKLGQLYLNEGVWMNDTIFSKEWHDYSLTPTPNCNEKYGAHIWLNGNPKEYPSCPDGTYKFSGYEGQYVIVIPSLEIVVVRLGLSKGPPFDMDKVLGMIIDAVG